MFVLASLLLGIMPVPITSDVAECVVDNDMSDVRALLNTVPGSPDEARVTPKVLVLYGACDDNRVVNGALAWRERAEIAEAAAIKMLGGHKRDIAGAVSESGWALALPASARASIDYNPNGAGMRMVGDCILRNNPQASVDLIASEPGSPAESAAIGRMSGNLGGCLYSGQTLKLQRQDLRLIVAEPLYHLLSR